MFIKDTYKGTQQKSETTSKGNNTPTEDKHIYFKITLYRWVKQRYVKYWWKRDVVVQLSNTVSNDLPCVLDFTKRPGNVFETDVDEFWE